jgi:hypothetical protein
VLTLEEAAELLRLGPAAARAAAEAGRRRLITWVEGDRG